MNDSRTCSTCRTLDGMCTDSRIGELLPWTSLGRNDHELPERFSQSCVFMDCVRQYIARPSENQQLFYSGFTGNHNITRLVVTSPCGFFLAASNAMPGRNNDMNVANASNVTQHLAACGAKAMTDKGFRNTEGTVAALPRTMEYHMMVDPELAALSAIRTAGVEWPFGQLQEAFPYLVQVWKQKVFHTSPVTWFSVGMILCNMVRLQRGCNGNTYFHMHPIYGSVSEYIQRDD